MDMELMLYNSIGHYEYATPLLGSRDGLRYRIERNPLEDVHLKKPEDKGNEKAVLRVTVWPEPYCFEKTPEEQKTVKEFPFVQESLEQASLWIEEKIRARKEESFRAEQPENS